MLSLVLVLCVIGMIFTGRKLRRRTNLWYHKLVFEACTIVLLFIIFMCSLMFILVRQNDTGLIQQQIDTLTEANEQMENWTEIIENKLSDNPELLTYLEEYLNKNISYNNEEISRYKALQKDRVEQCRFLIYFR